MRFDLSYRSPWGGGLMSYPETADLETVEALALHDEVRKQIRRDQELIAALHDKELR